MIPRICLVALIALSPVFHLPVNSAQAATAAARVAVIAASQPTLPPPPEPAPDLEAQAAARARAETARQEQPQPVSAEERLRQDTLAALEAAHLQGPQAVLDWSENLRGPALDLVMEQVQAAREQLMHTAKPPADTPPVSPQEEQATLEARQAADAVRSSQARRSLDDPAEGQLRAKDLPQPSKRNTPSGPTAELTVGSSPCTYPTITAALAAADDGDQLLLEGGVTFIENPLITENITLQGGYAGCGSASANRTTIDGGGTNSVIRVSAALSVTLEQLNLTHGNTGSEGGGIEFALGAGTGTLTLENVDIYGNTGNWGGGLWVGMDALVTGDYVNIYQNTANSYGGGVRLYGGRAEFTNSNIYANLAPAGAGVYGTRQSGFDPLLDLPFYADLYDNQALTGDGYGGGVYLRQGSLTFAECSDLISNDALTGGGAYLITSTLTINGDCSEIERNTAQNHGGGVYGVDSTVNLYNQAELFANQAGTGGIASGGGAFLDHSVLYSYRASIHQNQASLDGGGIYALNNSTVHMDLGGYSCLGSRCSQLSYNTAGTVGYGGGISAWNSTVYLDNTWIEANTAQLGGSVYAYSSNIYANNDLLAGNDATAATGDGIRLNASNLEGAGLSLAYNDLNYGAGGRAIDLVTSSLSLDCSLVWGHASSLNDPAQSVTYSDIQGGYAGTGNLDLDPQFVSTASHDYHLQAGSPVIDRCPAGTVSGADMDNEIRPLVQSNPATPYDMGADEFSTPRVGINGSCTYGTLQQAINAAVDGDVLQVSAGSYSENLLVIDKNLTIAGDYDATCTGLGGGDTTLDGSYHTTSAVTAYGGELTLRSLIISGGSGTGAGLDVQYDAQVTLQSSLVTGNHGDFGGGAWVGENASLTLDQNSDLSGNSATIAGGGARIWGRLVANETLSDIEGNSAPDGGGLSVIGGRVLMNGSDIRANQATGATGRGGGILIEAGGVITLTNTASVYQNTAFDGAGLYVIDSEADLAGTILNNLATDRGAGVYAQASRLNFQHAQIGGSGPDQPNQLSDTGHEGAGLYLTGGTRAVLSDTLITGNQFLATSFLYGGGALVENGSILTMTNSLVSEHSALDANDGRGAGLYLREASITLENTQVLSNTAGYTGGGVRVYGKGELNILDGSSLRGNQAQVGDGGGLAVFPNLLDDMPAMLVQNATMLENQAAGQGGAVYLGAGTLDFAGSWQVNGNQAGSHGGAIAIGGTGEASFNAGGPETGLEDNSADGNGGALYLGNDATVEVYANQGFPLPVQANRANGSGGAFYAGAGGTFDVFGQVILDGNQAGGDGGAVCLLNASSLWLDDYLDIQTQATNNQAMGSGGAIYAQDSPRVECDGTQFGLAGQGNHAVWGSGGAIYLDNSSLAATNCIFQDNQAALDGGALAANNSKLSLDTNFLAYAAHQAHTPGEAHAPDAPHATGCDPLVRECSAFLGNHADQDGDHVGNGGAIYLVDSQLDLRNQSVHENRAWEGGAFFQSGASSTAEIANTLVYSNAVSGSLGAGVHASQGGLTLTHVTLANNTGLGAAFSAVAGTDNRIYNSLAWGNQSGGFVAGLSVSDCNLDQSDNAGPAQDPLFRSPGSGRDYALHYGSPGIDVCSSGLADDLLHMPRPFGAGYDMGAFEFALGLGWVPDQAQTALPGSSLTYTQTLSNTGLLPDSYALSAGSSQGWALNLTPSGPVDLEAGQSAVFTLTVSLPGGVISGTLDSTWLQASSTRDPLLSAQAHMLSTAAFQGGVELAPDHTRLAVPVGTTLSYTHWITNTGNFTDTFDLHLSSSQGWSALSLPAPVTLGSGLSAPLAVQVVIPAGSYGLQDITQLTVTSLRAPGVSAAVTDTTQVEITRKLYLPVLRSSP